MSEAVHDDARVAPPRVAPRRNAHASRVDQQPGFVLHAYAWRETSLIVEVFTRDYGRVALVARVKTWSGRNDIKSLVRAEWCGGLAPLRGDALLAGFYVNELLVRLLARADAHEVLFGRYTSALAALAAGGGGQDAVLRTFELELLREIGHAPAFDVSADGEPLDPDAIYRVDAERGLVRVARNDVGDDPTCLRGSSALSMARNDFSAPGVANHSKLVLRHLIRYHLNGQPLNTRRILHDLRQL
jgi:DNA repair protein RecO (recombination protein O)